jgi:hypothetical protein
MVVAGAGRARGSGGFDAFYSKWRLGLLGIDGDAPRRPYRERVASIGRCVGR